MTLTPVSEVRTKWNMSRVYTFDIEAYEWTNPIALGMSNPRRNHYETFTGINCIELFVNEIMRRKYRNIRFVAHNGGNYDFIPVIEHIAKTKESRDIESLEILTKGANNTPFFVRIEDKQGKPRYLQDSFALMPRSLSDLTESFTPDFAKLDYDINNIQEWNSMPKEDREEMLEYLKRDCESLYRVLEEFTDVLLELTHGNCPPQLTVGSTSMSAYRSTFMPEGTVIQDCYYPDYEQNPEECFRHSYFGGRTEVYQKYGQNLKHYDVNSLYPYCYARKPIPVGKVTHSGTHFPLSDDNIGGVIKINATVPNDTHIPVLPVRYSDENITGERVIFPTGNIQGWYMAKEVRYAKRVGALEDIEILDSYMSKYGKPFEQFGESLYTLKQSIDKHENPGKYKVVKFLLNSFYGKFGMDRFHESVCIGPITKEFQEGKEMINDKLANQGVMLEEQESFAPYIIPRIASAITAQARIEMHKWFTKVKDKGGSVWYCDTDSIVTNVDLPEGTDMGEMDLEGELQEGIFLAPKVYAEKYREDWEPRDELVKAKGMRDPQIDFETYRTAYENNNPGLIESEWQGPRGLTAGMKFGEDSWFEVEEYSRQLQQFDQKRSYGNGGSNPLNISG
jgi:hypothetical protein